MAAMFCFTFANCFNSWRIDWSRLFLLRSSWVLLLVLMVSVTVIEVYIAQLSDLVHRLYLVHFVSWVALLWSNAQEPDPACVDWCQHGSAFGSPCIVMMHLWIYTLEINLFTLSISPDWCNSVLWWSLSLSKWSFLTWK